MRETFAPSAERARQRAGAAEGAAVASTAVGIAGTLASGELSNAWRGELKVLPVGLRSGTARLDGSSFLEKNAPE